VDRSPKFDSDAFDCPDCGAYSHHRWAPVTLGSGFDVELADGFSVSRCEHCRGISLWRNAELVYPMAGGIGPEPHGDMPESVRELYREAQGVCPYSRRSAAALLRLALQVLIDDLEDAGGDVNAKIGRLVRRGLSVQVQQAMDVVRVVGNNAVHPGQLDVDGDSELVPSLFSLINVVVEQMITTPKTIGALFDALPEGARTAITRRDGAAS
jgi:hypothetical protein